MDRAALAPPAHNPHNALIALLTPIAVMRNADDEPGNTEVIWRGKGTESSNGDATSSTVPMSLRISARKRYDLASGKREVPRW
jgi:hypothetical protein